MIPLWVFAELYKVEKRSWEKYKRDWRDGILFSRCYKKMRGHIDKHEKAGRGNSNPGPGVHHMVKVIFYGIMIIFFEEFKPDFDDREVLEPVKKRKAPVPKPDC